MKLIFYTLIGLGTLGVLAILGVLLFSSGYDETQLCTLTFLDIACMIGANATRPTPQAQVSKKDIRDALP